MTILPDDIVLLPALSCLKVPLTTTYPDGIGNLKSLRVLDHIDPSYQSLASLRDLGELLYLRELHVTISGTSFPINETCALQSSIEKLINYNLRCLTFSAWGIFFLEKKKRNCSDLTNYYDGWNSIYLPRCRLEQLHLWFPFPRFPVWISPLITLISLEICVDELCEDGIVVLAGLPALTRLVLWAEQVPDEGIVFSSGTAFRSLGYFEYSHVMVAGFTFQAGSMPLVETLRVRLCVRQVKECGVRIAGIEQSAKSEKGAHRFGLLPR